MRNAYWRNLSIIRILTLSVVLILAVSMLASGIINLLFTRNLMW